MSNKIQVLFVDDEPAILEGLQNRLRSMRKTWRMSFASCAQEALVELSQHEYDVIVSDMRMPGMDGADLLQQVRAAYPQIVRIVLSGQTNKEGLLRVLPIAHRTLSKPCETADLQDAVEQGITMQAILGDTRVHELIGGAESLPALPKIYRDLSDALEQTDVGINAIAEIIESDVSITARLLQFANSAFFGSPRQATQVRDAVTQLGANAVQSLVLSEGLFSALDREHTLQGFSLATLQAHSIRAAQIAQRILGNEADNRTAYSAAMLHDIGHILLATTRPEFYEPVYLLAKAEGLPLHEAEERVHGFTHAKVGAYLLDLWGLPFPIVEAVAHHHYPNRAGERKFGVVGAVYVANRLAHLDKNAQADQELDTAYLAGLGVLDKVPAWMRLANKIIDAGGEND